MLCKFVEFKLSVLNSKRRKVEHHLRGSRITWDYITVRCLFCRTEGVKAFISESIFYLKGWEMRMKRECQSFLSNLNITLAEQCGANGTIPQEHNHNTLWLIKQDIKESLLII